jgi:hypothetical protein
MARGQAAAATPRAAPFSLIFCLSLLTLNFPFRRHMAAGDGRQTLTGRTPETGNLLYVYASRA